MRLGVLIFVGLFGLWVSVLNAQHQAHFTKDYQRQFQDSVSFEIPVIHELFHVVCALSSEGKSNSDLIDQKSEYYQKVLRRFGSYKTHPAVVKINKELKKNRYNRLKMDATGFYFDEGLMIQKDSTYPTLSFEAKNWLEKYIPLLQEFADQSLFMQFYSQHKSYYDSLIQVQKQQLNVRAHWKWLEEKCELKFNSYRIVFSPLVYGSHCANHFEDPGFKQSIMFIGPPYATQKYEDQLLEALVGRMVFTEIDHNYLNPITQKYKNEIETQFEDLKLWNNGKYSDYNTPMATFNEYITYAFYSLFVIDQYPPAYQEKVNAHLVKVMNNRGFIQFEDFNERLLKIYKEHPEFNAEDLIQKELKETF